MWKCSAGLGVLKTAKHAMARMLGGTDKAHSEASQNFWVIDKMVRIILIKLCGEDKQLFYFLNIFVG